ncbi:hypothetical protein M8818_006896 [Zalaria obscura]|uniref:Uncharacterized protein n=1 Tax=Zalaria obscura TaxID=2024903 RepID=A0ACC3S714_9PEZI
MEHYKPHPGSVFEGYYHKFRLPSGAHLALIICTVPKATEKPPHMVSFTYVPHDPTKIFQKEVWVKELEMIPTKPDHSFEHRIPGMGYVKCGPDSTTEYSLDCEHFSFHGKTTSRTPWSDETETPEGLLVNLPLPLHWHVQSLSSDVSFTMKIPSYPNLPASDRQGIATVHQEKNWANSFPSAHIWIQARDHDTRSGITIAGGQILGLEAYLLGFRARDPKYNTDFRPPFATALPFVGGPTMAAKPDWGNRTFELSVQSWRRKVVVKAEAPKGTFFSLSSPFPDGHRENFLGESFRATVRVQVFEAGWWGAWVLKHEEVFEGASLEFGGGYYPPAGSEERWH